MLKVFLFSIYLWCEACAFLSWGGPLTFLWQCIICARTNLYNQDKMENLTLSPSTVELGYLSGARHWTRGGNQLPHRQGFNGKYCTIGFYFFVLLSSRGLCHSIAFRALDGGSCMDLGLSSDSAGLVRSMSWTHLDQIRHSSGPVGCIRQDQ